MNDKQRAEAIAAIVQAREYQAGVDRRIGRRIFYGYIIFLCCIVAMVVCGL